MLLLITRAAIKASSKRRLILQLSALTLKLVPLLHKTNLQKVVAIAVMMTIKVERITPMMMVMKRILALQGYVNVTLSGIARHSRLVSLGRSLRK